MLAITRALALMCNYMETNIALMDDRFGTRELYNHRYEEKALIEP